MSEPIKHKTLIALGAYDLAAACDAPDLLVITGSQQYGTERRDAEGKIVSDLDLRGFVVPPWEYIIRSPIGKLEWDITEYDGDHIVYSLRWFLETMLGSNPQLIECLFAPESCIIKATPKGRAVIAERDAFVSKRFYRRIVGFSNSEWRKARGVKIDLPKVPKTDKEVINEISNRWGPKWGAKRKDKMDRIIDILYEDEDRVEVSSYSGISEKRRGEFDQFGYCVSSACHSVRLMRQCTEMLQTGSMTFPRPDAAQLRDIKMGRIPLAETVRLYDEAKAECDAAFAVSTIPEAPDAPRIAALYNRLTADALRHDKRIDRYDYSLATMQDRAVLQRKDSE